MRANAAPPAPVWSRALALVIVAGFAALVLGHYHDRFWWPPDDGAYAHVAERVLGGEVLNRDVQDVHAGYVNFANALALRVFGDDLVSLRYPLVAMGFVQACLIFLLLAPRGAPVAAAAGVAVTALSFVQFLNPTPHWYALFLFVTVVCVVSWLPPGSRGRLEILGFLVVTVFLFRQLSGVIVAIGVLTYLLCEAPRGAGGRDRVLARALVALMAGGLGAYLVAKTDLLAVLLFGVWPLGILAWAWFGAACANRHVLRLVARLGLGGSVAAAPLVVYHLAHGSFAGWFDDTVATALLLTDLDFVQQMSYGVMLVFGPRQVIAAESLAGVLNGLFWVALPLLAVANGGLVVRALLVGANRALVHPLPFLAAFYALVSAHYQTPIHLFYTAGMSLAGLLWMATRGTLRGGNVTAVLAIALSAVALHYHAAQPLSRGLGGTLRGERVALAPSAGLDRATLWMEPADARLYRDIVELIRREVREDETILAIPFNPEFYFLSRRRNPTRYFNSAFGVRDAEEAASAVAALSRAPPKLVIFRPDDKYNTPGSAIVMDFVRERYELFEKRGGFEIYRYLVRRARLRARPAPGRRRRAPALSGRRPPNHVILPRVSLPVFPREPARRSGES